MKKQIRTLRAVLALALVLMLTVSGCSWNENQTGDDHAAAVETPAGAAPETEPTEEPTESPAPKENVEAGTSADSAAEEETVVASEPTDEPADEPKDEPADEAEKKAETPAAEPRDSEALAAQFLAELERCDPVEADDNRMGFSVTGIEKDGSDYIVNWSFSNEIIAYNAQNMAYAFSLVTFYDPEDLDRSYQGFTIENGSLQVSFEPGESISYDHVRIRSDEFSTDSGVVYMYFEGAPDEADSIRTVPMFYTLILGDEPKLAEEAPRNGAMLFLSDSQGAIVEVNAVPRSVEIGEIGRDADNHIVITLVSDVFRNLIADDMEKLVPVIPRIMVGDVIYDPRPLESGTGRFSFVYDTETDPDAVLIGALRDFYAYRDDAFVRLDPVATASLPQGGSAFRFDDPLLITR